MTNVLLSARARTLGLVGLVGLVATVGSVAVGCSSDDNSSTPTPTGDSGTVDTDAGVDGAVLGDGGTPDATADDGGDGSVALPVKTGDVHIFQTTLGAATGYAAAASFTTIEPSNPPATSPVTCTASTQGDCKVTVCVTNAASDAGTSDAGADDGGPDAGVTGPTFDSAGDVTFTGGQLAAALKLTPGSNNTYPPATGTTAAFTGGDVVAVSAAGATVPAFSDSLNAPGNITVTAPTFNGFSTAINKAQNLSVTWSGGGATADGGVAPSVLVTLGSATTAKSTSVVCTYPLAGGTGVVPAAALTDLDSNGAISIAPIASKLISAGDYNVTYSLSASGASGSFTAN